MTLRTHVLWMFISLGVYLCCCGCWSKQSPEANEDREGRSEPDRQSDKSKTGNADDSEVVFTESFSIQDGERQIIELPDGMQIVLPPGAFPGGTITITKHRFAPRKGDALDEFEYYDLAVGNEKPQAEVTLIFPLELSQDVDPAQVRVLHYFDDGKVEELPGEYDHNDKQFAVKTRTFSSFSKPVVPGDLFGIAEALSSVNPVEVHLRPRYYSQFDHMWCWATSFAMLIGSHGKTIHPQEIADLYGVSKNDGFAIVPIFGYSTDAIEKHPATAELPLKVYRIGGMTEGRLRGFLIDQLNQEKPIWLGLPKYKPGSDHIIVVVGYRWNGLIIHDPSGSLFAHVEGITEDDDQRAGEYANYFIPFDKWHNLVNAWNSQIVVIDKPLPADGPKVSMQVPLGDLGISFQRTGVRFINQRFIYYYWNTRSDSGGGFSAKLKQEVKRGREGLSNSDLINEIAVVLHNTGEEQVQGQVRIWLDDTELLPPKIVTVLPEQTNQREIIFSQSKMVRPASPPPEYVSPSDRSTLVEGLDFNRYPLPLGKHTLKIGLYDASGQNEIDREIIEYNQLPALVPQATAEPVSSNSGRKMSHTVRFDHSPEAARLGADNFSYEIWRTTFKNRLDPGRAKVATVEGPFDGRPEITVDVPPAASANGVTMSYQVVAIEKKSGLKSPFNQPSDPVRTMPSREPQRFALKDVRYVIRARQGGRFQPHAATLKPTEPLKISTGTLGPYELDLEIDAPSELSFSELAILETGSDGKPFPGGRSVAVGLTDQANFVMHRVAKVTKTNDRELPQNFNVRGGPKEIYSINLTSGITLMNFNQLFQPTKNEDKPSGGEKYELRQSTTELTYSSQRLASLLEANELAQSLAPQEPQLIGNEVRHFQRNEKPIALEYSHEASLPKGAIAETMKNVMLMDAKLMEQYETRGGAMLVHLKTEIKQQFPMIVVDVYLVYVHQP